MHGDLTDELSCLAAQHPFLIVTVKVPIIAEEHDVAAL